MSEISAAGNGRRPKHKSVAIQRPAEPFGVSLRVEKDTLRWHAQGGNCEIHFDIWPFKQEPDRWEEMSGGRRVAVVVVEDGHLNEHPYILREEMTGRYVYRIVSGDRDGPAVIGEGR